MKERLEAIKKAALEKIEQADAMDSLNDIRVSVLGKKGYCRGCVPFAGRGGCRCAVGYGIGIPAHDGTGGNVPLPGD